MTTMSIDDCNNAWNAAQSVQDQLRFQLERSDRLTQQERELWEESVKVLTKAWADLLCHAAIIQL